MLLRPSASPPPVCYWHQSAGGENVRQNGLWLTNFSYGDKISVEKWTWPFVIQPSRLGESPHFAKQFYPTPRPQSRLFLSLRFRRVVFYLPFLHFTGIPPIPNIADLINFYPLRKKKFFFTLFKNKFPKSPFFGGSFTCLGLGSVGKQPLFWLIRTY